MHFVRRGLRKVVDEEVRPGDLTAVMRTSAGMGALQQFTTDKRLLHAAIERVRWYPGGRAGVGAFAPLENDAMMIGDNRRESGRDASRRDLRDLPGRKSVVLFSDGFEIHNNKGRSDRVLEALRRLTDLANRASVTIYAVDARGLPYTGLTAADSTSGLSGDDISGALGARSLKLLSTQAGLSYLAEQTGGLFLRNNNDLGAGARRALDDMRGYYLIGYRPDAATFEAARGRGRFHDISVKVRRPGLRVRTRKGFYGFTDEAARPAAPLTRADRLLRAITSPFGSSEVPLKLTSVFTSEGEKEQAVTSLMYIDVSGFKFTEEADGWRRAVIDVLALTFGENGQVIDEVNRTENVRLRGETFDYVRRNGLLYTLRVPVKKPGAYQLRTAVRDAGGERTGSASQFIEVPNLSKGRLALSGLVLRGVSPQELAAPATPAGGDNAGAQAEQEADPMSNAAVRRFKPGAEVVYFYQIFNAKLDRATARPRLQTQMRIFRDGRQLFAGQPQDFDPAGQTDFKRLQAGARVRLRSTFPPGEYVLQIVVTDLLARDEKTRVASQWIEFEIVK